jgi:catechol 2,3-dioxygenase-like lactoylglutathione lyase family enzyme
MDITGLDLLFLEVNSLQDSIAFYRDQLGFEVLTINPDAEPPMATLRAGRLKITIVQQLETMLRRGRGVHFFLGVTNVELYYEDLQRRDVEVQPPVDEGWGGRFITVQDPDKYRFFFVEWADV